MQKCAKCSITPYCSRECQKIDWKAHKKTCGKDNNNNDGNGTGTSRASTALFPPKGLDQPIASPFTHLDRGTWLHDRPEKDVYRLLIDAYRMQVEDDYTMDGDVDDDSIYGGAPDGRRGLRRFVARAAARGRTRPVPLLPPWWSPAKMAACERLGMNDGAPIESGAEWSDLRCAVEKSDVIEHYGDARFPMQLRMFAEAVNGRGPGGSNGTAMRKMMVVMESGQVGPQVQGVTVDATTGNTAPL